MSVLKYVGESDKKDIEKIVWKGIKTAVYKYTDAQRRDLSRLLITMRNVSGEITMREGAPDHSYIFLINNLCDKFQLKEEDRQRMLDAKDSFSEKSRIYEIGGSIGKETYVSGYFATNYIGDGRHNVGYAVYKTDVEYNSKDRKPWATGTMETYIKIKAQEWLLEEMGNLGIEQ